MRKRIMRTHRKKTSLVQAHLSTLPPRRNWNGPNVEHRRSAKPRNRWNGWIIQNGVWKHGKSHTIREQDTPGCRHKNSHSRGGGKCTGPGVAQGRGELRGKGSLGVRLTRSSLILYHHTQTASKDPAWHTRANDTLPTNLNTTTNTQPVASKERYIPQDGIVNLSDHKLSEAEVSLLKKGLSFVPTPLKITTLNHEKSLSKLRDRHKHRFSLPTRTERLIDCTFESIKYNLSNTKILRPRTNLTKKERKALFGLKKNKDIIISKADKGDTIVIMNISQLVELAHEHLSDSNTYQLLTHDPTPEVVLRFNHYIQECRRKGVISKVEFDRLHLPENTSTQTIYFLPKLHKNPLRLRPIISCTNGPTHTASAFLDKLLQPHMKRTKSFLKKLNTSCQHS